MLPIIWRAEARADLLAIITYIAERNVAAAERLHAMIEHAVERLPMPPMCIGPAAFRERARLWFTRTTSSSTASPKRSRFSRLSTRGSNIPELGPRRILFRLRPVCDRAYLDRRVREETGGDYGIEDLD